MRQKFQSWIETFFLIVLAVRPSLDITTYWKISIGPITLNPAGAIGLALIAAGSIWLGLLPSDKRRFLLSILPLRWMALWLLLLIPWALAPVWNHGSARLASIREWIRLLSFLPFFAIFWHMTMEGKGNRILAALFVSLIVPALTGLYQIVFHQGMLVQNAHRIQSTFAHPNPFSFYLVMMAGLLYWKCRWSNRRMVWVFALTIALGLLISTFSFTGAGMLGILILVLAIGENRRLRYTVLGLLWIFIVLFTATPTGRQRIRTVTQWDNLDEIERTGRETSSMVWRLLNWRFLIRTWQHSPWVGYGLDSSPFVNPNRVKNGTGPGQEPHNDYVRFLIDTGIIGSVLFLVWLAGMGYWLAKSYQEAHAPPERHFAWIAIAVYCTWLAGSFNDNLLIATAYQYGIWAVFAVSLGWSALGINTRNDCENP